MTWPNHQRRRQRAPVDAVAPRHGVLARLYLALGFALLFTACVAVGAIVYWIIFVLLARAIPHGF